MRVPYRRFVWFLQSEMVERYSERTNSDRAHFFKVARVLAQDSSINALIEINPPRNRATIPRYLCPRSKAKRAHLGNNVFVSIASYDIVVHKDEVFFLAI